MLDFPTIQGDEDGVDGCVELGMRRGEEELV